MHGRTASEHRAGELMRNDLASVPACVDEWKRSVWGKVFSFSSRRLRGGGFAHSCEDLDRSERTTCLFPRRLTRREIEALPLFQTFMAEQT